ncbi:MAG: SpoIIE family protein phosphatase [Candidatus Paraimprobicoccus trichonymphae]|uniref:SpoIIE family protein phosphatase n=1 Tax=Candidatus Paraimprobicoccus trichonymphae TaxID=3033793 RepID=A0AA48I2G5_9FIRM|nr:MAG: SpoIIE family protein phosphatase [Candidatus Paraimprobicoccus trichonymphae]
MKKSFPIILKLIIIFLSFATVISTLVCIMTYFSYKKSIMEHYLKYAINALKITNSYIEPEKIKEYAENLEPDENYFKTLEKIREVAKDMEAEYVYLQIPISNEKIIYIFDTIETETDEEIALGVEEIYDDESFKNAKKVMETGEPDKEFYVVNDSEFGYVASAYIPIKDENGETFALLGMDMSMNHINNFFKTYLITIISMIVGIVVFCIIILLLYMKRYIINPIVDISKKTGLFVKNVENRNFSSIKIKSNDEIGHLARSVNKMFEDIKNYSNKLADETAQKERIQNDINVAKTIQESVLPHSFPPFLDFPSVEIYASMSAARGISGDFYDFFIINDHEIAFLIADVSDKGVPAALFTMIARTLIKNQTLAGDPPHRVFEIINDQLGESNNANMFVTAFLGVLDVETNNLVYANAGHNPPIIRQANGETNWVPAKHGFVLAAVKNTKYESQEIALNDGDYLILYTDGVTETEDEKKITFGEERLYNLISEIPSNNQTPRELTEEINVSVKKFSNNKTQTDDITMLVVKKL